MKTETIQINPDVFCNSPWYEFHIFQNGDLAFCCQQQENPYEDQSPNPYNISQMSLKEWFDSEPMRQARLRMFSQDRWHNCRGCWDEEKYGETSRRIRSNQKSVLFRSNMELSYQQSPDNRIFEASRTNGSTKLEYPVDLHIDLGNHCNLACKMCGPAYSTTIASKMKQWKLADVDQYLRRDWTKDTEVWEKFLNELVEITDLKHIHIMGGEPTIHPRFKHFIKFLIDNTDSKKYGISFVTNGTNYDPEVVEMLKQFKTAAVEISVETANQTNNYIRQGSDISELRKNVESFMKARSESFYVTLRPCISSLSIRDYWTLIKYALDNQLLILSRYADSPQHLRPAVIPYDIRQQWKENYIKLQKDYNLEGLSLSGDINESNVSNYREVCANQIIQAIGFLDAPDEPDQQRLLEYTREFVKPWDNDYGFTFEEFFPELC